MNDRCNCPTSRFFPHRKEKCAFNRILKTTSEQANVGKETSHSPENPQLDQPNSANNASTGTVHDQSTPENSAEELEELGNRMCNCLLARKFPHRASKCLKASIGKVADEASRKNAEQSKIESLEREAYVPTGQTGAKPDPQLGSNAHCGKVPDTEHSLGQKPSTENRNTHHQDSPNPSHQMKVGHIPAHNVKVQGTEHNVGQKPNTKNKNTKHQKNPNLNNERNVGQTPGSQKNHYHNRQQKNSSETAIINQKSNPNSKELKAQHHHPHPHPAPRQTVIESTTVRTTTTYQTVTRGLKK
jgi:hypothetical protein